MYLYITYIMLRGYHITVCEMKARCCAATKKLRITADDQIAELYVDGKATSFQSGGWQTVRTVDIDANTKVIAVKAIDVAKVNGALCELRKDYTGLVVL